MDQSSVPAAAPRARVGLGFLPMALIAGVFWADAMILAVVYAYGLETELVAAGNASLFAPWNVRVLQYVLLFPLLLLAYRWSLRIGWRSWSTKVPLQILIGFVFALLARPALILGELLLHADQVPEQGESHADADAWFWVWALFEDFSTLGVAITGDFFLRYGFGLALVCDIRVGALDAKYGANFVKLGLAPGMSISYLLPRLVGMARANELLLTGRLVDGREADTLAGHVDLRRPLRKNEALIATSDPAQSPS